MNAAFTVGIISNRKDGVGHVAHWLGRQVGFTVSLITGFATC